MFSKKIRWIAYTSKVWWINGDFPVCKGTYTWSKVFIICLLHNHWIPTSLQNAPKYFDYWLQGCMLDINFSQWIFKITGNSTWFTQKYDVGSHFPNRHQKLTGTDIFFMIKAYCTEYPGAHLLVLLYILFHLESQVCDITW